MSRFCRFVLLLAVCFLAAGAGSVSAQDSLVVPFYLPTPEGWRTETIPFPLGFAPELEYEGLEELRFAPGMFDPEDESFWTYAFVWWITSEAAINADTLEDGLRKYYDGLATAVMGDEAGDYDLSSEVSVAAGEAGFYSGTIATFDGFKTKEPVTLNFEARLSTCDDPRATVLIFEVSPQPASHEVWIQLEAIRSGFDCPSSP